LLGLACFSAAPKWQAPTRLVVAFDPGLNTPGSDYGPIPLPTRRRNGAVVAPWLRTSTHSSRSRPTAIDVLFSSPRATMETLTAALRRRTFAGSSAGVTICREADHGRDDTNARGARPPAQAPIPDFYAFRDDASSCRKGSDRSR